jgi:hypothetical protein
MLSILLTAYNLLDYDYQVPVKVFGSFALWQFLTLLAICWTNGELD